MKTVHEDKKQTLRHVTIILAMSMPFIIGTVFITNKYSEGIEELYTGKSEKELIEISRPHLERLVSKSKEIDSIEYILTANTVSYGEREVNFSQKGGKIKISGDAMGHDSFSIFDKDENIAYLHDPIRNIVLRIDINNEIEEIIGSSMKVQSETIMDKDPMIVASENLNGKDCLVVEYSDGEGLGKMWIWKENGIPIRVEPGETSIGLRYWQVDAVNLTDIPEHTFDIPEDIEIMEMPTMTF